MSERTTAGPRPAAPSAAADDPTIRPFRVDLPEEDLDDLRRRLALARLPFKELVPDRSQGVQLAALEVLARYWAADYDLRRVEARLNALPQFITTIDGVDIHFLHVKSPHADALPLIMTHDWPGSVIEMLDVQASGAWLEDKEYAVAVHTRRVADPDNWATPIDQAAREIAARHGLEVVPGKLVWELRPAVPSDKGDAVRRVAAESAAREVVVVGDDLGDLAAFAAVAGLAAEGGRGLRVAVRSAEAPPQLLAEADLVVQGPPGVLDFLQRLAA
jgi:hypothetical protein